MDGLSSPASAQPRTDLPSLHLTPAVQLWGGRSCVAHGSAVWGLDLAPHKRVPQGAAWTHCIEGAAKNMHQSWSPWSQSESPGSTGMAAQLHRRKPGGKPRFSQMK